MEGIRILILSVFLNTPYLILKVTSVVFELAIQAMYRPMWGTGGFVLTRGFAQYESFFYWTPPGGRGGVQRFQFEFPAIFLMLYRHIIHQNVRETKPDLMEVVPDLYRQRRQRHGGRQVQGNNPQPQKAPNMVIIYIKMIFRPGLT